MGRNKLENNILEGFAGRSGTRLEVEDINGPVTLVLGYDVDAINVAAKLTARYSDAQRGESVWVKATSIESENRMLTEAGADDSLESLRIKAYSN